MFIHPYPLCACLHHLHCSRHRLCSDGCAFCSYGREKTLCIVRQRRNSETLYVWFVRLGDSPVIISAFFGIVCMGEKVGKCGCVVDGKGVLLSFAYTIYIYNL